MGNEWKKNEWKKDERKKKKNIKTFNDTKKLYGNLLCLRKSIMDSMTGQKLFKGGNLMVFPKHMIQHRMQRLLYLEREVWKRQ